MAGKLPKAEEFLNDPKYGEQKSFFKSLVKGLAEELQKENESSGSGGKKTEDESDNIFDSIFGGK